MSDEQDVPEVRGVASGALLAEHLPSSPELVETILEQLPDPMTMAVAERDADGRAVGARIVFVNAAGRSHFTHRDAGVGHLLGDVFPNMLTNGTHDACLSVLNTGVPVSGTFRWKDDVSFEEHGYDYRVVRVGDDLLVWMHHDTSDLLSAIAHLEQADLRTRTILDALDQAVVLQAADRRFLSVNRAARRARPRGRHPLDRSRGGPLGGP